MPSTITDGVSPFGPLWDDGGATMRGYLSLPSRTACSALGSAILVGAALVALALPAAASAGSYKWAKTWTPRAGYDVFQVRLAAAPGGGVYAGTTPCSPLHQPCGIAVARYSSAGQRLWAKLLTTASPSALVAVANDPSGNLVVVGYAPTGAGGTDWLLAKLDPGGKKLWVARLGGVASQSSIPSGVVVNAAGAVYVCGRIVRAGTTPDAAVAKFSASGKSQWTRFVAGGAGGLDQATALTRDAAGNIYVTGYLNEVATMDDVFVARFSPGGQRDWLSMWNNPVVRYENDYAWGIAVSSAGVAVAGSTTGAWDTLYDAWDRDGLVLTLTLAGATKWVSTLPGTSASGELTAVYTDAAGNVAAAGPLWSGSPATMKAALWMLSPAGFSWHTEWLPAGAGAGAFDDLTWRGATLVATGFSDASGSADVLLFTITPGLVTWTATYDSGSGGTDEGTDVLCRAKGIFVGGSLDGKLGVVLF